MVKYLYGSFCDVITFGRVYLTAPSSVCDVYPLASCNRNIHCSEECGPNSHLAHGIHSLRVVQWGVGICLCVHAHVCALCVGGLMIFMGFQVSAVNMCVALGYQCKQCVPFSTPARMI